MAASEHSDKTELNKICKFDGRILRSRHYKRQIEESRPVKRLFTPEIKRYLKTWLIRRRENPYPSREEKIELAAQTGLTYIQFSKFQYELDVLKKTNHSRGDLRPLTEKGDERIVKHRFRSKERFKARKKNICNWFANWRRKLKNSGKNVSKFNWSTLIKSYNDQALGNVEHISISSDDSIWEELDVDQTKPSKFNPCPDSSHSADHCYTFPKAEKTFKSKKITTLKALSEKPSKIRTTNTECLPQCFQISSTTDFITEPPPKTFNCKRKVGLFSKPLNEKTFSKYLGNKRKRNNRDKNWNYKKMTEELKCKTSHTDCSKEYKIQSDPFLLSKWRKSAALFQSDYNINPRIGRLEKKTKIFKTFENVHGREELDAAEALTFLSRANKF